MLGINPTIISHLLSVNPNMTTINQKKRMFSFKNKNTITKEVDKLLKAGFI